MAQPGVPLRRPIGSDVPFALQPDAKPVLPDEPKPKPSRSGAKPQTKLKPVPPDRTKLTRAEEALRSLDEAHRRRSDEFERRRIKLAQEESVASAAYRAARQAAEAALNAERLAYQRAGGDG